MLASKSGWIYFLLNFVLSVSPINANISPKERASVQNTISLLRFSILGTDWISTGCQLSSILVPTWCLHEHYHEQFMSTCGTTIKLFMNLKLSSTYAHKYLYRHTSCSISNSGNTPLIHCAVGLGHILNIIITPHFALRHNGFEGSFLALRRIFVLFEQSFHNAAHTGTGTLLHRPVDGLVGA